MRQLLLFLSGLLAASGQIFGYFNERCFEGIDPIWKASESVQGRLEIVQLFIPENPTIFEAGAKDGTESLTLASTWPKGKVISFEPNPNQFAKYLERAKNVPNMFGYNLAVNTYNGKATFYLCWGSNGNDPVFEGASSLLEPSEAQKIHYRGPEITVPCVVLDDWCKKQNISRFDFMWLDLEGFEMQLLKSSPQILKTVKVIYTETNFFQFRKGTTPFSELENFLGSQGFTMIAHWYNEGLQGDAIFVRDEILQAKGLL